MKILFGWKGNRTMKTTDKAIRTNIRNAIQQVSGLLKTDEMKAFLEAFTVSYAKIGDSNLYGGKHCGSDAEHKGADYIVQMLRDMGINAESLPFQTTRFQFNDASITIPGQEDIKPYACLSVSTDSQGIDGPVIDVGEGFTNFYAENDIKGKIALVETKEDFEDGTILGTFQMYEAEKHGAAAIILYTKENILDERTIRATYSCFACHIPVVTVSYHDAQRIRQYVEKTPDKSIHLYVDTDLRINGGTSYEVIGEIKGKTDERIVYSAHYDHFFRSIQDNITAVATLLGIAKAIKASGYVPNRTITFVFSGSHEIGPMESAAPDLLGAWELLHNLKPEWEGKVIADINFEYTGLAASQLRSFASHEMCETYFDFLTYMPEEAPGFPAVNHEIALEDYPLLTWCDACPFIMQGVPVFMNDVIHDQIYEDTSPYIGRDHTNMDNFDSYSAEAHLGSTWWYGCLGIYLDQKPVLVPDFSRRIRTLELTKAETALLKKEQIPYQDYEKQLQAFQAYGQLVAEKLRKFNGTDQSVQAAGKINAALLKIQKLLAHATDGLTTAIPSMITVPHKVYLEKGTLFQEALRLEQAEGYEAAYEQALRKVDLAGLKDRFSHELPQKMKQWVLKENQTWNQGKCKNFFTDQDLTPQNWKTAYEMNRNTIEKALRSETDCLKKVNGLLIQLLIENADQADIPQMMEWIKGFTKFPHRRTGTEEGKKSAHYVMETFQEIGLSHVEEELVPSICMDCDTYELEVDGKAFDCFFINGANRKALTGDFDSKIENAEIVYLGKGEAEDFANTDIQGKIVLCDVYFKPLHPMQMLGWMEDAEIYDPHGKAAKPLRKYDIYTPNNWPYNYLRAMEKGAAGFIGILCDFMDCHYFHEDYIDIVDLPDYMRIPGVWVSANDGEAMKRRLREQKLTGNLRVHTVYEKKHARIIKGEIKGKSDDIIVIHSHHDAVSRGAVQDASGMSVVFGIADFFARNQVKPEKTLMFVSTDSHYTDYEGHVGFLENRKQNQEQIILDFAVEHIAQEMDLDENNQIILTGEPETRMIYVSDTGGLLALAKEAAAIYGLEKTVFFPVRKQSSGAYTNDDVCSDAYDFNAAGIPVVSLLAAPMYLFHNSDTLEKVHQPSLKIVLRAYLYMILKALFQF